MGGITKIERAGVLDVQSVTADLAGSVIFPISADENAREQALRERFARFWATAAGAPRSIYDSFIAGSPLAEDVDVREVHVEATHGWWVRPQNPAPPGRAILFIHGGGYGQGTAKAYRGFASQIVS